MALLRLLARDSDSVALVPTVVVPDLFETFYAITVQRRFAPPLLRELLRRPEADVLRAAPGG